MGRLPYLASVAMSLLTFASTSSGAPCVESYERAQRLRLKADLVAARRDLRVCAQPSCPAVAREDCERWLREVDAAMPTVIVVARSADGADIVDVRVRVDDVLLVDHLDGRPLEVNPGQHTFQFELPSGAVTEQRVLVNEAERDRLLHVDVSEAHPRAPDAPAPPVFLGGHAQTPGGGRSSSRIRLVLTGVGIAVLGLGASLDLAGTLRHDDLARTCGATGTCWPSSVSGAHAELVWGDTLGVIGLAVLGGALVTWLISTPRSPAPAGSSTAASAGIRRPGLAVEF